MEYGELPAGWANAYAVDVVEILDSQRIPVNSKERAQRLASAEKTYPYYGATGQVGVIDDYIFDGEAVLLGEDGAPFLDPYRDTAYRVSGKYWVNNHAHILRSNGVIDHGYLCHQLNTLNFRPYVSGTTRLKLTQGKLKELPLRIAPLVEQQRIAEKIEMLFAELDKGEEALRQVQKLLARYRQSVLKAAVTGALTADWRAANGQAKETGRDLLARILKARRETWQGRGKYKEPMEPGTDGLPELPEGWVWASVEQLATVIGGLTKNKKRSEMPMKRPMLRVANVYQDRLELDDVHESGVTEGELDRVTLRSGDLLVVEGNGSKDQIGRMAVWNCEIPQAVHQNHLIKVRMEDPTIVAFAMKWFHSPQGRQNIELVASSTSGLYTLSISKIERLMVPVPSKAELEEICDRLDEAFARMAPMQDWCETEFKRSGALRQSILKDAFSGKLIPQDPSNEPADKLLERIRAASAEKPKATRKRTTA